MPTPTYTPIATLTLSSNTHAASFTNIPQTFKDLVLVASVQTNGSFPAEDRYVLNGITTQTYAGATMTIGGSKTSFYSSNLNLGSFTAGINNHTILEILDYTATNKAKIGLWRKFNRDFGFQLGVWTLETDSAITSIDMTQTNSSRTMLIGTNWTLYGIAG